MRGKRVKIKCELGGDQFIASGNTSEFKQFI